MATKRTAAMAAAVAAAVAGNEAAVAGYTIPAGRKFVLLLWNEAGTEITTLRGAGVGELDAHINLVKSAATVAEDWLARGAGA